jgi:hypothetical protein
VHAALLAASVDATCNYLILSFLFSSLASLLSFYVRARINVKNKEQKGSHVFALFLHFSLSRAAEKRDAHFIECAGENGNE